MQGVYRQRRASSLDLYGIGSAVIVDPGVLLVFSDLQLRQYSPDPGAPVDMHFIGPSPHATVMWSNVTALMGSGWPLDMTVSALRGTVRPSGGTQRISTGPWYCSAPPCSGAYQSYGAVRAVVVGQRTLGS